MKINKNKLLISLGLLVIGLSIFAFYRSRPEEKLEIKRMFLPVPGLRTEYFVSEPVFGRPWPAIVFLHDDTDLGAEALVKDGTLARATQAGFAAVSLSQPGFGRTEGIRDFGGPLAQRVTAALIQEMRDWPEIRAEKIILVGRGRGAIVAANVAAADSRIAGVVLIDPLLDVAKSLKTLKGGDLSQKSLLESFEHEVGFSMQAIKDRSLFAGGKKLRTNMLGIQKTPSPDLEHLAKRINGRGLRSSLRTDSDQFWSQEIFDFVRQIL